MITLHSYLKKKRHNSLNKVEAKAFGISWPLVKGWVETYAAYTAHSGLPENPQTRSSYNRERRIKSKTSKTSQRPRVFTAPCAVVRHEPKVKATPGDVFYASRAWRQLRYLALRNTNGRCQCCGSSAANGIVIHVDHIKPRPKFPHLELALDNLQVLCEDCNMGKSNWDETDWRHGLTA